MPRTLPFAIRPLTAALAVLLPTAGLLGVDLPVVTSGPVVAVTTCADSGTGSLRSAFTSAVDNETIDLTQLQCSQITLTSGELVSTLAANTITVSASSLSPITIDASGNSRIFRHRGTGVLFANNLVLKNGTSSVAPGGGCVYTLGSFFAQSVTISSCTFNASPGTPSRGGAVFAESGVSLFFSSVTGSQLRASGALSSGGGIFGQTNVTLSYSTIDNNQNVCAYGHYCRGGGIYSATINSSNSTISNNKAEAGAGIYIAGGGAITQSTISGNVASGAAGGVLVKAATNFTESTIVQNRAGFQIGAGVYLFTSQASNFKGTIVYGNTSQEGLYSADISGTTQATITGSNNLIGSTSRIVLPGDTFRTDPKLGPLQNNGGVTKTHALTVCGPAIDNGSQGNFTFTWDQRGPPYRRVTGASIDIGATEFVPEEIFRNGFDSAEARPDSIAAICL